MTKKEAKLVFASYLKERNIKYCDYISDGDFCFVLAFQGHESCPDKTLECSIYFFDTCMECRVYYTKNAAKWIGDRSEDLSEMYRILNFVNARIWPFTQDGIGGKLYAPHHLLTPRFYITEDGNYDLTATTVVDYDHLELSKLEVADYCTAVLPELMNKLSIPLFLVLLKEISVEEGIRMIRRDVLKEVPE